MATYTIKQAIDMAKENPDSEFATQLRKSIESGSLDEAAKKQGYDLSPFGRNNLQQTLGQGIVSNVEQRGQNIQEIQSMREQGQSVAGEVLNNIAPKIGEKLSPVISRLQQIRSKAPVQATDTAKTGQVAGVIGDTFMEVLGAIAPEKWKEFGKEKVQQILGERGIDTIEKYNEFAQKNPMIANNLEGAVNVLDILPAAGATKGVTKALNVGQDVIETGVRSTTRTVSEVVDKAPDAIAKFISPDLDPKFKNALQRATKDEVTDMENIVKGAVDNADNPSAFEIVGEKLAGATEQINSQVKSLSQQKKTILGKAKNGMTDFTKETGEAILDINRSLKNSNLGKSFISKLKTVKTKLDADNAIDELQDILYKGNKDMTIPVGSKEDKLLKVIIGKYNGKLKDSLPNSYKKINQDISDKLNNLELLNKSLGEVVDGVPIRGASLIKQYFSPAGTKAKELFEFVKKNTGYDVGKDSVLAKYMSEIYGEARAKSLLEGLPTTAQGTLDKLLDFTLQKTGVSDIVSNTNRKGAVLKAKDIAK